MTNNPSARAAGTMETIQWYEKAGLHCRTNHRQGSSFSLLRAPLLFSTSSVYIYHDPWYTIYPVSSPALPLIPLSYFVLFNTAQPRARFVCLRTRGYLGLNFLFSPSLSRPSLRTAWKESYAAEWPLIPRELLRSTFLPPFVRASAALRALLSRLSSAISQRCWLCSPVPLLVALTFRNHEEWNDISRVTRRKSSPKSMRTVKICNNIFPILKLFKLEKLKAWNI